MNDCVVELRVRYAETDQMRFAHHANYIAWFEMARIELLRHVGLSYAKMENDGYMLPVLEVNVKYLKPAFFDDRLCITARFAAFERARFKIEYNVYRDGTLISTGYSVHAFMNREGRAIRPPSFFTEKVQKK